MNWTACEERMPPRPETPYKVYLVWVLQQIDNATGAPGCTSSAARLGPGFRCRVGPLACRRL